MTDPASLYVPAGPTLADVARVARGALSSPVEIRGVDEPSPFGSGAVLVDEADDYPGMGSVLDFPGQTAGTVDAAKAALLSKLNVIARTSAEMDAEGITV